ncbi:MAG: hypothetical protein MUF06_07720 [Pirellulaceae bacterium]|jgi:hypothetical protein|nr:hypothetical protein [Pirellulaceae bacterium]
MLVRVVQGVVDVLAGDERLRSAESLPLLALAHQKLGHTAEAQVAFSRIGTNDEMMDAWSRETLVEGG